MTMDGAKDMEVDEKERGDEEDTKMEPDCKVLAPLGKQIPRIQLRRTRKQRLKKKTADQKGEVHQEAREKREEGTRERWGR